MVITPEPNWPNLVVTEIMIVDNNLKVRQVLKVADIMEPWPGGWSEC